MLFTQFYLIQEKKYKPGLCLQQADNIVALDSQLFSQQTDKKHPLVK